MDYCLVFIVGFIFSLVFRIFFIWLNRSWFKQGFQGDSSVHFAIIKQLHANIRSRYVERYVISPEPMSYPLGFHRFSVMLPQSLLEKKSYLPNLILFSFFSAVFLSYIHYIEDVLIGQRGISILLISAFIFYVSISNTVFLGPSIAYLKLSERLLARMSTALFFMALFAGAFWTDYVSFGLSAIMGVIAITSSIFARQAILFTTLLMSVLWLDFRPLTVLTIVFLCALLISRDHFIRGMKHTVMQWSIYQTHTKNSRIVQKAMSRFIDISALMRLMKRVFGDFNSLKDIMRMLISREPTRTFFFYPEIFLLFLLLPFVSSSLNDLYMVMVPVLSTLIVYVLTSTSWFNQLGESYRYIEYNLFFLVPFLISFFVLELTTEKKIIMLVIYGFITLLFIMFFYRIRPRYSEHDKLKDFLDTVSLPESAVVFPVTMRLGADICARVNCKSFWWQPGIISKSIYDDFIEEYPFLKKDFFHIFKKYDVTHVICDKQALKTISWQYDFSQLKLLHEDRNYIAYAV